MDRLPSEKSKIINGIARLLEVEGDTEFNEKVKKGAANYYERKQGEAEVHKLVEALHYIENPQPTSNQKLNRVSIRKKVATYYLLSEISRILESEAGSSFWRQFEKVVGSWNKKPLDELQILVYAFSSLFRENSVCKELFEPDNSWYQRRLPISSVKMPVAINEHINPLLEKSQRNVREFRKLIDEKIAKEPTTEKYGEFRGTKVCYESVIAVFQLKWDETGDDTSQVYIEDGSHRIVCLERQGRESVQVYLGIPASDKDNWWDWCRMIGIKVPWYRRLFRRNPFRKSKTVFFE